MIAGVVPKIGASIAARIDQVLVDVRFTPAESGQSHRLGTFMKRQRLIFAVLIAALLLAFAQLAVATADAQQAAADPRVADLAHAGKVRVGLFLPQYIKDTATGQLRSVWVEIAWPHVSGFSS